jgi:hypothetical protein
MGQRHPRSRHPGRLVLMPSIPTAADADARGRLLALINASWTTQAIRTACVLRLPESLASGPCSVERLAEMTSCHAPSLRRLLRALVTLELCAEREDGAFALTPLGALLHEEAPHGLRAWAMLCGGPHWATWSELELSVRSGVSYRLRHLGHDDFRHLESDPKAAALFQRAMVEITRDVAADVLRAVDFSAARLIVDVGGGFGELLATILQAYPAARGVLYDLPHAIDTGAGAILARAGVAEHCECVAGSFFDSVPAGGDVYLLKSILHDWDDERCMVILRNCRSAMPARARLLIIERIVPERVGSTPRDQAIARSDLNMLVALSGRERTEAEFSVLLESAGLRIDRVVPAGGERQVIEARAG